MCGLTDEKKQTINVMVANGFTWDEICSALKVSKKTISKAVHGKTYKQATSRKKSETKIETTYRCDSCGARLLTPDCLHCEIQPSKRPYVPAVYVQNQMATLSVG